MEKHLIDMDTNHSGSLAPRAAAFLAISLFVVMVQPAGIHRPVLAQEITLNRVTTGEIATDNGQFAVGAWADFRNSGLLDLFVCNFGGTNVLYRNNGNGTFTKITQGDPVRDAAQHVCPAVADFDNDGFLDLLVTVASGRNRLYRNNGDGTFSPFGGGVTNTAGAFNACAVADYDNDGLVDLFIPGFNARSLLFHNSGGGTFQRIQAGPPGNDTVYNTGSSWSDYDGDGFMDLMVNSAANDRNYLYHNSRDGTFTAISTNAIATDSWPEEPWGAAWGDYDNDGLPDLFVTGMTTGNRLYHNDGNGAFTDVTAGPMLDLPQGQGSRACAWGDWDNDGYLDLFVCGWNGANQLFHNNADGTFTEAFAGDATDQASVSDLQAESCGWVDYDNDGFLDLYLAGIPTASGPGNRLFHNSRNGNSWVEVKLIGIVSNSSAIGAKVRVQATIGGKRLWQTREINSGGGRWIQPLVAHFGLRDATNIETIRIEWPSGIVQTLTNVMQKQVLTFVERMPAATRPPSIPVVVRSADGTINLTASGESGFLYLFQASTNLDTWSWLGVRSNATGNVQFIDSQAANYPRRYYRASIPAQDARVSTPMH